jgi:hypothetical protein
MTLPEQLAYNDGRAAEGAGLPRVCRRKKIILRRAWFRGWDENAALKLRAAQTDVTEALQLIAEMKAALGMTPAA